MRTYVHQIYFYGGYIYERDRKKSEKGDPIGSVRT